MSTKKKSSGKGDDETAAHEAPVEDSGEATSISPYIREETKTVHNEAEKVKMLALLKAIRDEMNQPLIKGMKVRDFADIFVDRYNFFHERVSELFPKAEFNEIFIRLEKGTTSLEKIRLEITLLIAYIQNDIMDIIEQSERLKQKNQWLQDRLREFEIKIAGIQAIK
jgi:hypothetical protein